jgi:uncharacterized membrane protein YesL
MSLGIFKNIKNINLIKKINKLELIIKIWIITLNFQIFWNLINYTNNIWWFDFLVGTFILTTIPIILTYYSNFIKKIEYNNNGCTKYFLGIYENVYSKLKLNFQSYISIYYLA